MKRGRAGWSARWWSPPTLLDRAKEIAREMTAETSAVSIALTRQMLWRFAGAPDPFELIGARQADVGRTRRPCRRARRRPGLHRKALTVVSRKGVAGHAEPVSLVAGHATIIKDKASIMSDQFSNSQQIRKPAVTSKGGIVASQSRKAAEVGAAVLAAGGDCVDAVIATTFALGVLEPWMSGVGGGGAMVLYRARENRYEVIDYGMRAPNSLRVEDYPLTGDGAASDIFPWPRVKDDRNLHGPGSIAVPGVVAGMEEAHRRHARMPWQELLGAQRRTRRRRPSGGLVDHADDRELGRRPPALSRQRRRLSARTACRRTRNGASSPACGCRRTG